MNPAYQNNPAFWEALDKIIQQKGITIDRPKGSRHPRFKAFIYPYDYGYVNQTLSTDGVELDIWVGTSEIKRVSAILNIVDMDKLDTELKILYATTPAETNEIFRINNEIMMHAVLLLRHD
jgi:inorganic pyrophosphatase